MLPFASLLTALIGILSFLIFGNSILLLYGWRRGVFLSELYLYLGVIFLITTLFGKSFIRFLFRKKENDPPQHLLPEKEKFFTTTDSARIHIDYFGEKNKQTILLIHGWGTDANLWYYQIQNFRKDYRILAYDLPGLGKSTQPHDKEFTVKRMAIQLKEIMLDDGQNKFILIGHSIGGMIIQTLEKEEREFFNQYVVGIGLIQTTYTNPVKTSAFNTIMTTLQKPLLVPLNYLIIFLSPLFRLMNLMSYLNGSAHLLAKYSVFDGNVTWQQLDFATKYVFKAKPSVNARGTLGMLTYDCEDSIQTIKKPTNIIAGEFDRLTLKSASEYMHKNIPKSELKIIQAGHAGILEEHTLVNQYIRDFLGKITK